MAAIDFPSSPITNQIYSINNKTWKWNGTSWTSLNPSTNQVFTAGTINAGSTASTTTTIIAPSVISQNTLNSNPVVQGYSYQSTAGSFSFVLPSSANAMRVLISGGGGSGGAANGTTAPGGGGGGGGSVMFTLYNVTPGTSFSATLGTGGASVPQNNDGLTGTASTFSGANISITCSPGAGGLANGTGSAGGATSVTGLPAGAYLATTGSTGINGSNCGCTPIGGTGGGAGIVADRVWPMGPSAGWVAPFNTYIRNISPINSAGNGGNGTGSGASNAGATGGIVIYYFNSNFINP
jgi:hypothetical protein